MQDENLTQPQEGMNPESEVIEETVEESTEETQENQVVTEEETVSKDQFNQVIARAKKAEAEIKALKAQKQNITNTSTSTNEQVEITVLKSQGMSADLIDELKIIAKVRGKSLIDSMTDPIFVAIKEKKESETKAQKARLGASRGATTVRTDKTLSTPGLTEAEHRELWNKSRGN